MTVEEEVICIVHIMVGVIILLINVGISLAILHGLIRLSPFSMVELIFLFLFSMHVYGSKESITLSLDDYDKLAQQFS